MSVVKRLIPVFFMASVLAVASVASGDVVVLRDGLHGYSGTIDLFVQRTKSTTSQSNLSYGGRLVVDIWGSPFPPDYVTTMNNDWKQGILKFDNLFGSIDAMAINSATLTLEIINPYEKPDIRRIIAPWTEANASWDHFDTNPSGTNVGDHPSDGGGLTPDVNTSVIDFSSATTIPAGPVNIDVTAAVQSWFADPSSNLGWAFFKNDEPNRGMFVTSEDTVNATQRPTLTIDFTPVPEPATAVLLAVGALGVLLLTRRRLTRAQP